VEGHTDRRASDAYNQALAARRANNVAQYLTERGIAQNRIAVRSLGEEQAYMSAPQDEADHALNRRVNIVFVGPGSERIRVRRQIRDVKRSGW
jgi:outer membrane protein OmpA-like peptidoglycan-associated protein